MTRVLKWLGFIGLCLLLILAATWAVSRAVYPTAAQRAAIAELERKPTYEGENAFALLWTLDRAVPDEELEDVLAEDVRRFRQQPESWFRESANFDAEPDPQPSAAEAYPDLGPSAEDRGLFCRSRQAGCLAQVSADLERYTDLVERNKQLLARVDKLQRYDYLHSEFPFSIYAPVPAYSDVFLLRTRHAVQFANGQRQEALAATCREMLTWRRLGSRADNLIARLVGDAVSSRENGDLLAEMLAEMPVDEPLPEICDAALAPPAPIELSLCNALRGEFGLSLDSSPEYDFLQTEGVFDSLLYRLTFDPEATVGLRAEGFQYLCKTFKNADPGQIESVFYDQRQQDLWRPDCFANRMGCTLQGIAMPAYGAYQKRVLDHGARLRTLGTLAWMRGHAGQGQTPQELLASRPAELSDPSDGMSFGPEGKTLRIALRDTRQGTQLHWSVPLPPALYASE